MTCQREALPVLPERFRCDRLAGKPTLSVSDCAARWRRAQRPVAEDPYRPVSFETCAGCADGAMRNGAPPPAPPHPPAPRPKEDLGEVRREVLARVVRERGQASMADLLQACRDAGLDQGHTTRQANRITRHHLGAMVAQGRVKRLAKGVYGTRRATPPPTRRALALAWVDEQAEPWAPAALQAALVDTLRDSTRPRQRVYKLLRRLVAAGEVERVGLGTYAAAGLFEALAPAPVRRPATVPTQLAFFFAA
ncbi:MAG: hypothetical protein EKK55_16300 [Rhodocyclaceae bacterium]|nr:MAG: hypothetical protein EKK55_16300 [Rhodocyclaceae bacterium]